MKLDPSAFVADPELIKALEKRSTSISCEQDRVLFTQGDSPQGLYIIDQGETTLTMTSPAGDQLVSVQAIGGIAARAAGADRQRALFAYGHRPQWRAAQLHSSRRGHQPHAQHTAAGAQNAASAGRRGPIRPKRLV